MWNKIIFYSICYNAKSILSFSAHAFFLILYYSLNKLAHKLSTYIFTKLTLSHLIVVFKLKK